MSLMIRFMLSLCLLLSGAIAHTCSHNSYFHQPRLSPFQNYEVLVGKAPAPGKRTDTDNISAEEIEEDDDSVPSRKEVKKLLPFYSALSHSYLNKCHSVGTVFTQYFNRLSSPAFIINCVFRI